MSLTRTLSGTTHCRPLHRGAREGESLHAASLATRQGELPWKCFTHVGFQHVNECMGIVPMNRIRSAGRIYHRDHQTFLAGKSARSFDMSGVTAASCAIRV